MAELRAAARLADEAASSTAWLASHNARRCAQFSPAAGTLVAAANAAANTFRHYRGARTRYGTREELELITTIALELREARAALGRAAGEPAQPPSGEERTAAQREVGLFRTAVALAHLQGLVEVDDYNAKCVWVAAGPTDEAFVALIGYTPPGVQGRLPAGNCAGIRPDSPPFYNSRKRYLSVSGGERKSFQNAVGGNERVLEQVLAAAEAAGVGRACR